MRGATLAFMYATFASFVMSDFHTGPASVVAEALGAAEAEAEAVGAADESEADALGVVGVTGSA